MKIKIIINWYQDYVKITYWLLFHDTQTFNFFKKRIADVLKGIDSDVLRFDHRLTLLSKYFYRQKKNPAKKGSSSQTYVLVNGSWQRFLDQWYFQYEDHSLHHKAI